MAARPSDVTDSRDGAWRRVTARGALCQQLVPGGGAGGWYQRPLRTCCVRTMTPPAAIDSSLSVRRGQLVARSLRARAQGVGSGVGIRPGERAVQLMSSVEGCIYYPGGGGGGAGRNISVIDNQGMVALHQKPPLMGSPPGPSTSNHESPRAPGSTNNYFNNYSDRINLVSTKLTR